MNTSKRIPKKVHARLLVGLFTILMLFNFIAPTFGVFVSQKSAVVYAQEPAAEDGGGETSNVPCYDPPKSEGLIDRGLDIAEGIPIVGSAVGTTRALSEIAQDPLKWFVCGVSEMLTKAIDFINVLVSRLMLYDPTKNSEDAKTAYSEDCSTSIGGGGSDGVDEGCADAAGISESGVNQLKLLWRNVLNVVNIVLVLAMLIMVISSALDFGIFSNYTIKKTLPKIVVAAIAANLSWVICSTVITGINYVGIGIQQVMISPLTKNDGPVVKTLSDIALTNGYTAADTGSNMGIAFQGPILLGIGGLTWVVFSSMGVILLPLAAIILLSVIVAFIVLLLRRILLILLVMLAPVAFAAWALPGGEGIFKKWWKSFTQLLLIYPYAMILMGAGVVVSSVIGDTGGANFVQNGKSGGGLEDLLTAFLMLLAMVLPYILLPTAFKAISGVLGTLTGMMNDKGKGLVDRATKAKDNSSWGLRKKMNDSTKALKRENKMNAGLAGTGPLSMLRRRQAFGGAGLNPLRHEANKNLTNALQAQQADKYEKEQREIQKLKFERENKSLTTSDKLDKAVEVADNGATLQERNAAKDFIVDNKSETHLRQAQDNDRKHGSARMLEDEQFQSSRYSDIKPFAAHLLTSHRNKDGTFRDNQQMATERAATTAGLTQETLATQKATGVSYVSAVGGDESVRAIQAGFAAIGTNDTLRGKVDGDTPAALSTRDVMDSVRMGMAAGGSVNLGGFDKKPLESLSKDLKSAVQGLSEDKQRAASAGQPTHTIDAKINEHQLIIDHIDSELTGRP